MTRLRSIIDTELVQFQCTILSAAYIGAVPCVKDGLLFYKKHDLFFYSVDNVKCFECLLLDWLSYSYECDYWTMLNALNVYC